MITIRRAEERGRFDHGWLNTYHTFSFADYYDPMFMGFRTLRVINEDRVQPGQGFGTHAHRDMEIVSYVVQGGLAHKDSMGNGGVIRPGDVQRMSAGTGVRHSEFNASDDELVHFLQIWILPERQGLPPGYEQKTIGRDEKLNRLRLIGSPDPSGEAVTIHQDVRLYASVLELGNELQHELDPGRFAWVQILRGEVDVNENRLGPGDGAAVSEERTLRFVPSGETELLLFDLS